MPSGSAGITDNAWNKLVETLPAAGGTTPAELRLLNDLGARVRSNCIVEIGSYLGRSTIALAAGSLAGHRAPVYAVEPHEAAHGALGGRFGPRDRATLFRNLLQHKVTDVVHIVNLRSTAAARGWDRPIALLFIDGDHRYEAVRADFEAWNRQVVSGGAILFHDAFNPELGVGRLVREVLENGGYSRVIEVGKICGIRKQ